MLMFRQLNVSRNGDLTLDDFLNVYDIAALRWSIKGPIDPWFSAAWPPLRSFCRFSRFLVTWKYFEYVVGKSFNIIVRHKSKHYLLLFDFVTRWGNHCKRSCDVVACTAIGRYPRGVRKELY